MQPKQNIVHLPVYQPGKPIEEVKRELGLKEVTKLASNENPFGCSPAVKDALAKEMGNLSLYPDGGAVELTGILANHWGLNVNQFLFGAGSDDVILMIARAYLVQGDETIMASHTFPQYKHNAEIEGAVSIEVPLKDGAHDLPAMLSKISDKTKIMWVCNPNNPTGTMISHEEIEGFLEKVPSRVMVILDEAYAEYNTTSDYPDGAALLKKYKNLVLLRTFSKIYGLASLRIGYAIADPAIIHSINQVREPFNTSRFAQSAAIAAIRDQEFVSRCRDANQEGIRFLQEKFDQLGLPYYPAHGNFIMVDVKRPAEAVFDGLLRKGFIIRGGHKLGFPTSIRVTVGSAEQNQRFIEALKLVLTEIEVTA